MFYVRRLQYYKGVKRLYLLTLEVAPLEVGKTYVELPSHLTLMSRFWSELMPEALSRELQPAFARGPVVLTFGETTILGPKKVVAHMVESSDELELHRAICKVLDSLTVEYQYPEFIK